MVQDEPGDWELTSAGPELLRADAVPAAGVEVPLRLRKLQVVPQWMVSFDQRPYQSEVERGVGEQVDNGGAGREYPVLHAHGRPAVRGVVDGPVPAEHRAVVQAQLGKARDAARVKHRHRILVL